MGQESHALYRALSASKGQSLSAKPQYVLLSLTMIVNLGVLNGSDFLNDCF